MQCLWQAHLVIEHKLHFAARALAHAWSAATLQDAQLNVALDAEGFVQRQNRGADGICADIAAGRG